MQTHQYNELIQKVGSLFKHKDYLLSQINSYGLVMRGVESDIDSLLKEENLLNRTLHNLRMLLDAFSNDALNLLKDLINKGLAVIFYDRNYRFEYEITDSKRKLIKFFLVEDMGGSKIVSKIPDSIGGGIQVVISIIIQLFLIRVWERRQFLLLDEAFSQISSKYVPTFMEFIQYLVSDLRFNVLWITHDRRFLPYFKNIYNVERGEVTPVSLEDAVAQIQSGESSGQ